MEGHLRQAQYHPAAVPAGLHHRLCDPADDFRRRTPSDLAEDHDSAGLHCHSAADLLADLHAGAAGVFAAQQFHQLDHFRRQLAVRHLCQRRCQRRAGLAAVLRQRGGNRAE